MANEVVCAMIDYTVDSGRRIPKRKSKAVHATRDNLASAVERAQLKLEDVGAYSVSVRWPA